MFDGNLTRNLLSKKIWFCLENYLEVLQNLNKSEKSGYLPVSVNIFNLNFKSFIGHWSIF